MLSRRMCIVLLVVVLLLAVVFPAYADDGSLGQWSICNSGTTDDLTAVAYGNGLFVATGALNQATNQDDVLTSPDGATWTSQYAASNCSLYDVVYGNGIFVAVGITGTGPTIFQGILSAMGGMILTSKDGVTWTQDPMDIKVGLSSVTYGNGTFVAVGNNDTILTSSDGKAWSSQNATNDNIYLDGVCYGNGTFVAIGFERVYVYLENNPSYILTSPDGATWTGHKISTIEGLGNATWGNGLFVAVGTATTVQLDHPYQGVIATSPDGSTWTIRQQIADNEIGSVTYGDGLFVAMGANVDRGPNSPDLGEVMTSSDGVNWVTQREFLPNIPNWDISQSESNQAIFAPLNAVAYGNGSFVAVGDSGTIIQAEVASAPAPASPTAPATVAPVSPAQSSSGGPQPISFIVGQSSYYIGDQSFAMDEAPFISNGRTLVPVHYLADALGAQTAWDANAQKVTITMGGTVVELVIGSTAETTNGVVSQVDAAPIVVNGRTYLPARYVAEAFGYTVSWDAATQTISINK